MLIEELRGWKDTEGMSDDARRKVFLMRKAADRIIQLEGALMKLIDAHDAPKTIRARAIEDALMVSRGLTF